MEEEQEKEEDAWFLFFFACGRPAIYTNGFRRRAEGGGRRGEGFLVMCFLKGPPGNVLLRLAISNSQTDFEIAPRNHCRTAGSARCMAGRGVCGCGLVSGGVGAAWTGKGSGARVALVLWCVASRYTVSADKPGLARSW